MTIVNVGPLLPSQRSNGHDEQVSTYHGLPVLVHPIRTSSDQSPVLLDNGPEMFLQSLVDHVEELGFFDSGPFLVGLSINLLGPTSRERLRTVGPAFRNFLL